MRWHLTQFFVPLVQQIVHGGHLVVLVRVQCLLGLLALKAILIEHADDGLLERYLVFADDQAAVLDDGLVRLAIPLTRCDVLGREAI